MTDVDRKCPGCGAWPLKGVSECHQSCGYSGCIECMPLPRLRCVRCAPVGHPLFCAECEGATVTFRGVGKGMEYRLCSRRKEPGHLSEAECDDKIQSVKAEINPSGRQG